MTKLSPNRPCGRCGCQFRYHNPPKSSPSHRGSAWGNSYQRQTLAMTCCDSCPHCFCFCVAFIEPFIGMPFERCVYETENHTHLYPAISNSDTISRLVSSVQSRIPNDRGDSEPHKKKSPTKPAPKFRKEKRTNRGSYNLYRE